MNLQGLLGLLDDMLLDSASAAPMNLPRSARPFVIAALANRQPQLHVVITGRVERAHDLAEQLAAWQPALRVFTFAEPGPVFYERAAWGTAAIQHRLRVLQEAQHPTPHTVVVVSARALMQRTLPPDIFAAHSHSLHTGQSIRPDVLARQWVAAGYQPVTLVTQPGTFSRRGGIVDVFPAASDSPMRLEFFGDEIESLRTFDPASQRSGGRLESAILPPAREAIPSLSPPVAEGLQTWFAEHAKHAPDDGDPALPLTDQMPLSQGVAFSLSEFYLPHLYNEPASLLDYLPPDCRVLLDGEDDLQATVAELESRALDTRQNALSSTPPALPPDYPLPYLTWDDLSERLGDLQFVHELGGLGEEAAREIGAHFAPGPRHAGQLKLLLDSIGEILQRRERVVIVSRQAERLSELWNAEQWTGDHFTRPLDALDALPDAGVATFVNGTLAEGWQFEANDGTITHLLTDAEIFGWQRPEPRRRRQPRAITPEEFFADVSPGDYVVHSEYGIGRFEGLTQRTLDSVEREYLLLTYDGDNALYVPVHQTDRLSRYVGVSDRPPALSSLGTAEWSRVRQRASEAVREAAHDLLELYATRAHVSGHAFSPDTPWQHELEAAFPYVETEDQLHALREVKADMQAPRPMDRLLCGDVGYGKTEVALRAAFKAVMDGKQVAILVPTTVLAQQHYTTFARRLAPFPVAVEMLSRFRTRGEQQAVISGLQDGKVDIVIGTHRLLQADVAFNDLGLLVIDEEQRFGVTHKERFKQMRTEVDVLTLTATPIPRTLYMALSGARDISTISTPPEERLPVTTHVGLRDDDLIRRAVLREIDRGGQVFYVHNRVQTIAAEHARLARLIPEIRLEIGHGQMPENQLADVMSRFAAGEVDVLLSTTIIESGLDIPNANTLIVDRADRFGLAQLYQLRGRVGRSAARAYAYFFHPASGRLRADARDRLYTLAEQTQPGAGFSIAMRDLELRGAGDILGTRQSGHISAVGFHLYTRMLSQAVHQLRAAPDTGLAASNLMPESALDGAGLTIDLPLPAFLPTDYVPDVALRIRLYRRLAGLTSLEAIEDMAIELADRFGPLPLPAKNLLYQLQVKLLAIQANIEAISSDGRTFSLRKSDLVPAQRLALQTHLGHDARVSKTAIWLPYHDRDWQPILITILKQLENFHVQVA